MATILDISATDYPQEREGKPIAPLEGVTLMPAFNGDSADRPAMFWEHEGNAAVRMGNWKMVRKYPDPWELYDLAQDRTETRDLAAQHPQRIADMSERYEAWAARCGVIPREKILELMREQPAAFWEDEEA